MLIRVYKYEGLYIATLFDEEGGFISSSGHPDLIGLTGFIKTCKNFAGKLGQGIRCKWLGRLLEKPGPAMKISKYM